MEAYPLTRQNRVRLARAFANVPEVDISVACVVEDQMGDAFVDSADNPTVFMIVQDGFFTYFAGDLASDAGKAFLANVPDGRMLMAGSEGWHDLLPAIYGERLHEIKRYSFDSDTLNLKHLSSLADNNHHTAHIQRITAEIATYTDFRYLEIGAYDSPADFYARGIGYCMLVEDKIIGVAYASLACGTAIEISIFVENDFRRTGIATALATQLLIWCLENGVSPHWDAANEESCDLAEKLGYTNRSLYRAYFLRKPA